MPTRHPLCGRQPQTRSSPNYKDFVKVFPGQHTNKPCDRRGGDFSPADGLLVPLVSIFATSPLTSDLELTPCCVQQLRVSILHALEYGPSRPASQYRRLSGNATARRCRVHVRKRSLASGFIPFFPCSLGPGFG